VLKTDLLDLLNAGHLWAFVGSGVSVDAGCPTWRGLVDATVARVFADRQATALTDERFAEAYKRGAYPKCFSRLEALGGRTALLDACADRLRGIASPGPLLRLLADWPFPGYITVNYDLLLEAALRERQQLGWLSVGNNNEDVREVGGDATRIVWHVHGLLERPDSLVLTEEDYERVYADGSPLVTQLRGLLAHKRLLFVGFGFRDDEVMRLLRRVGMLSSPARPAFAFLPGLRATERVDLREKHNIDVIPYYPADDSHEELHQLLELYGSFLLRRTLRFRGGAVEAPSYDPETTSLLTYNELALQAAADPSRREIFGLLVKAMVLSLVGHRAIASMESLLEQVLARVRLLDHTQTRDATAASVEAELARLRTDGLILVEQNGVVALAPDARSLLERNAHAAEDLEHRFVAYLVDRARELAGVGVDPERIGRVAARFFNECATRRGLGVALAWGLERADFRAYHVVALLQALPQFMAELASEAEAAVLGRVVRAVLAQPSEIEEQFLGVLVQAHFGVNLLGYHPDLLAARSRAVSETYFLVDSSTLIPLLARSALGHTLARDLLERLRAIGSGVGTTPLLACEVSEHARYALQHVDAHGSPYSARTLALASGAMGYRSNLFIDGFVAELGDGRSPADFNRYLESACGPNTSRGGDDAFEDALTHGGLSVRPIDRWEGFTPDLFNQRDQVENEIKGRRIAKQTYRHDRQVSAEAEALIIVEQIRRGTFTEGGRGFGDAYFISNTGVIDRVAGRSRAVTMRPQAAYQWLETLTAAAPSHLRDLTAHLLFELSERGLSVVDSSRLESIFAPLISPSRSHLDEEVARHRSFVAAAYGEQQVAAFASVRNIDVPIVLESYQSQRADQLAAQVERERRAREAAQASRTLSDKEREEFERLRAEKKQRRQKAKAQRRAAASKPKRKRRKR